MLRARVTQARAARYAIVSSWRSRVLCSLIPRALALSDEQELAQSYRIRAEELRTISELDENRHTRDMLVEVAKDYDRMATTMDAIDHTNKTMSRRQRLI
jgi:hypothetical protein